VAGSHIRHGSGRSPQHQQQHSGGGWMTGGGWLLQAAGLRRRGGCSSCGAAECCGGPGQGAGVTAAVNSSNTPRVRPRSG
jgi:hypothetical protein